MLVMKLLNWIQLLWLTMVPLDLLEHQDLPEHQDPQVHLELVEHQDLQDHPGLLEHRDLAGFNMLRDL